MQLQNYLTSDKTILNCKFVYTLLFRNSNVLWLIKWKSYCYFFFAIFSVLINNVLKNNQSVKDELNTINYKQIKIS